MVRLFLLGVLFNAFSAGAAPVRTADNIHIDQFGYRSLSGKVAVISNPVQGFNASQPFAPSTGANQYELRRWQDDAVILRGTLSVWNNGNTDATSGDKAWWFDFSSVQVLGSYYVYDVGQQVGSYRFEIHDEVYNNLLRTAVRMFFYNRCNFEKKAQFAGANWADGASFVGPNQDPSARSIRDRTNAATARDLSGGWWDAGDYNKYTTFAAKPVHQLLDAYDQKPTIWTDDLNLPESGNGVPDLLDEVKWELDWLRKMQNTDGSAIIKMGLVANAPGSSLPPSTDTRPRYYYPEKSTAAAIAIAGMFAHAALVYDKIPSQKAYAAELRRLAILGFDWYENTPTKNTNIDDGTIEAGDADWDEAEQKKARVTAATYLYALTGEVRYRQIVDDNYRLIGVLGWWGPYETVHGDALLYYTQLPGATATVAQTIIARKLSDGKQLDLYRPTAQADAYRAYMPEAQYHWGSNQIRADFANINFDLVQYRIDPSGNDYYRQRAEDLLHALHGVNPLNIVYLTNMRQLGAEKSATRIYHSWFGDKTDWAEAETSAKGGPPPGYIPGGPNKSYQPGQGTCLLTPPCNQPTQKSYRDWNVTWPDASWSVTEPGIYYQSAYVKALSRFVDTPTKYELPVNPVVVITATEPENGLFNLFPNPTSSNLTVLFTTEQAGDCVFTITDVLGRSVNQIRYTSRAGSNRVQLSVQQLPAGTYLIRCQLGQQEVVRKVSVL
ncbi:glycoside hydrolase family 9 protein [Fibrella forsythiae]|uniref:Glycoside hydrolase family 9 protein n=1 Tax=Fibrella forsythiae TaxID=2817061 RepID=A0ABS3JQ55_9BACT|nr:glycoside hydrolase family 9 protein [Fibrella forsythiae]MBO0952133.1 glycoside hydrolase family 9 protein [Fibrella forsythiae]